MDIAVLGIDHRPTAVFGVLERVFRIGAAKVVDPILPECFACASRGDIIAVLKEI